MSLMQILSISGSAMSAQSVRLNTTASNLANVDSVSSSEDKTYRARNPVFAATMADIRHDVFKNQDASAGVKVLGVVESQRPLKMEYRPDHPMANEEGMIFKPNVNSMEEMANMISASRSYQVNVEVAETVKNLMQRTLSLGQ